MNLHPITILAFIITQVNSLYIVKPTTTVSLQSSNNNGRSIYKYPTRGAALNRRGRSSSIIPNSRLTEIFKQVTPFLQLQPPPLVDKSKQTFPYFYYIDPETRNGINVITNGKTGLLPSNLWSYPSPIFVPSAKPITEPLQEKIVDPTPVNKLTKAAVEPIAKFIEKEETTEKSTKDDEEEINEDSLDNTGKYEFGYSVNDGYWGTKFRQVEHREGEKTKGRYSVALPDGRMQHVQYWSDSSGYHAQVTYENLAKHGDPFRT